MRVHITVNARATQIRNAIVSFVAGNALSERQLNHKCMGNKSKHLSRNQYNFRAAYIDANRKQTEETNVVRTVMDGSSHESCTNMPMIERMQ